ncbi:MAG TPA: GAF domain-containing protein [Actinomycetota bacterium]|nr:GAF domain-containing protein [Actinomycetota bacterium]
MTTDDRTIEDPGRRRADPGAAGRLRTLHRGGPEAEAQLDALVTSAPAILWRWEPDKRCTYVSEAWTTLLGRDPSEALGSGWSDSVHPDDRTSFEATCLAALAAGEPFASEYRLRRGDGSYVTVYDQGRPMDPDDPRSFAGAALDVTREHERRRRIERLETLGRALAGSRTAAEVADAVLVHALRALEAPHGALGLPTADGTGIALIRQRGFDPKRADWRSVPLDAATPPARSFAEQRALFFPDVAAVVEAFPSMAGQLMPYEARAALPLLGRDRPLGVLYAAFDDVRMFDEETVAFFEAVADLIARTLDRAMLADDRERAAAETRVLLRISAALAEAVTMEDVRRVAATAAMDAVGADACLVGLVDPTTGEIGWDTGPYPPELVPLLPTSLTPGVSPAGDAILLRQTLRYGSSEEILATYPDLVPLLDRLPFSSRILVPIIGSEQAIGVMVASSGIVDRFGEPEARLLEAIGRQCAQSLERAAMYRNAREAGRELEGALSRLSRLQSVATSLNMAVRTDEVARIALDAAGEALGGSGGAVFVRDGDELHRLALSGVAEGSAYERMPSLAIDAGVSLCEAYRTGRLVWVPTQEEWRRAYPDGAAMFEGVARSAITIPFVLEGRVLGAMQILFAKERTLPKAERRLARTIGEQAAQALERARLYEAERHRTRQAELLQRVAAGLAVSATTDDVAGVLTTSAAATLGAMASLVVVRDGDGVEVISAAGLPDAVIDDIAVTPVDASLPGNDAIRSRLPSLLRTPEEIRGRYPHLDPAGPNISEGAWATFPFLVRGDAIGAWHLSYAEPQTFAAEQVGELATVVGEAAQAMARAQRFSQEREASIVLQESLLPKEPLQTWLGAEVVTRYWAGTEHLEVGGDWFDVAEMPNGCLAVSIGDVVGRGLHAAAAMGQLRSALRGIAMEGRGPAATLESLDRFAMGTPGAELATVVYGELDQITGEFCYACAGHPPPLARIGDAVMILDEGRSPLLAAGFSGRRREARVDLPPGATVLLYTDGLVERRGETFDDGIARLRRVLETDGDADLDALSEAVTRRLLGDADRADDVAFLCLRAGSPSSVFSVTLAADPTVLASMRMEMASWLAVQGIPEVDATAVVLAVNEAVANSIEHGYGSNGTGAIEVRGRVGRDALVILVRDHGTWRDRTPDPLRGHGLSMMRRLMDATEVQHDRTGTSVTLRRRRIPAGADPA